MCSDKWDKKLCNAAASSMCRGRMRSFWTWMRRINPLFALYVMWQPCIWFYAFFDLERKLRALLGNTQDLVRREQRLFSSVWQDCVETLINTKPVSHGAFSVAMPSCLLPGADTATEKWFCCWGICPWCRILCAKVWISPQKISEIHPDGSRWCARFDFSNQILNIALLQHVCL